MAFEQYLDPVFQGGGGPGPGNVPGLGGGFQQFGQQFRDRLRNRFANRSPNPGLRFRMGLGDILNRFFPQGQSVRENLQNSFQNAGTTTPSIGVQNQNNPYTGPQFQIPGLPQGVYGHAQTANNAMGNLLGNQPFVSTPAGPDPNAQRRAAVNDFAGPLVNGVRRFDPRALAARNYQ